MKKRLRENLTGYLFIAPNLVAYLLLTILPVIFVFYISFTDWDVVSGIGGIRFIGLDNYRELPYDVWFTDSLKNNIRYTVLVVPISLVLSLLVALALNDKIFAPAPVRTMFFVPYVANVVAISAVWMALYHPKYGPINAFLRYLGVNEPPAWLASTKWALPAIMIMNIWGGLGYNAVIYLAGLQTIPRELYEAAEIDGATGFQRLTQITLPMLTPTIFFLLITSIIGAFQL
ncbi:MAG: sugar ABC transporter permease, partial [Firmicutes bacterium]|nr:sugar ABC transporter permease [Bacillota bacterium]